jgi:hypothetical protein
MFSTHAHLFGQISAAFNSMLAYPPLQEIHLVLPLRLKRGSSIYLVASVLQRVSSVTDRKIIHCNTATNSHVSSIIIDSSIIWHFQSKMIKY